MERAGQPRTSFAENKNWTPLRCPVKQSSNLRRNTKRIAWTTQWGHGDKDHVTRTTYVDIINKNEHNQNQWGVVLWSRALCIMVSNRNCQFFFRECAVAIYIPPFNVSSAYLVSHIIVVFKNSFVKINYVLVCNKTRVASGTVENIIS